MKFLDIDGPLIQFLSKLADLMWLNILTILCCIPVITIGASLTALHYMAIKIVRGEEGYITKGFFKAFRENFKQSTVIWLIFMVIIGVLATDYFIVLNAGVEINSVIKILIVLIAGMTLFTFMYVFPLQSKFSNTVKKTIGNAFFLSLLQWPKTLLMIVLYIMPYVLIYVLPGLIPVILVFSLSVPAVLSARLYNKFFLKMEEQILSGSAVEGKNGAEDADLSDESMADMESTDESVSGVGGTDESAADIDRADGGSAESPTEVD